MFAKVWQLSLWKMSDQWQKLHNKRREGITTDRKWSHAKARALGGTLSVDKNQLTA